MSASHVRSPTWSESGAPGRRTVYSMCGMCAVRCPIEVTVENGRAVWLQGDPNNPAIGARPLRQGLGRTGVQFDDEERPQTPASSGRDRAAAASGGERPGTRPSTTLPTS